MATSNMIVLPDKIDASKITYGPPKNLDNGGKIIPVYHKGQPFVLQIPEMLAPYGMSKWEGDKGVNKFHIDLSFGNTDEHADKALFLEKIKDIDQKFIEDALNNSMTWFKKKYTTEDVIKALYTPLVKYGKDKETGDISTKYPPVFKIQLPYKEDRYTCEVYDNKRNLVNLNDMETKGAGVAAIVQCSGIWVAGGKFGCTWRTIQMKVSPKNNRITGYAFIDDCSDDDDSAAD
jgi:hypothetical protein